MKPSANQPCPCHSKRKHKSCCGPILQGRPAPTPESLMRSRYTAYASGNVGFILRSTHPDGPQWNPNVEQWSSEVQTFSTAHQFTGLTILSHSEKDSSGQVHFSAKLIRNGQPHTIEEDSMFFKINQKWLYWGPITDR